MLPSLQDSYNGSPALCFEKQRLNGVHFHERLLGETGMAQQVPQIPMQQQMKKKPRNGGTGIYFENSEVKPTEGCMHPLQSSRHHNHDAKNGNNSTCCSSMPPIVPCPVGQPLFAPPVLATSIVVEEAAAHDHNDDAMEIDYSNPSQFVEHQSNTTTTTMPRRWSAPERNSANAGGLNASRKRTRASSSSLSDLCSQSCKGEAGNVDCHLFCETKRSAMRQKLHSRDYRLSTDELVFVEAAVKLSKGVGPPASFGGPPPSCAPMTLSKPSLPHHVIQGRF